MRTIDNLQAKVIADALIYLSIDPAVAEFPSDVPDIMWVVRKAQVASFVAAHLRDMDDSFTVPEMFRPFPGGNLPGWSVPEAAARLVNSIDRLMKATVNKHGDLCCHPATLTRLAQYRDWLKAYLRRQEVDPDLHGDIDGD